MISYQLGFSQRARCGIYAGEVARGYAGEVVEGNDHAETQRKRGRGGFGGCRRCLDTENVCFTIQLLRNIVRIT